MIDAQHPRYKEMADKWRLIDDVMSDDEDKLQKYLRKLNPQDNSSENVERNRQYREAATWFGVTSQTVDSNCGAIFRKWPALDVPTSLEYLADNANGAGESIYQLSQGSCRDLITKGRGGLYVGFPPTDGNVSRADIETLKYIATINRIDANKIINWRTEQQGAQVKLSLVVLRDDQEVVGKNGYSVEISEQIRELFLEESVYRERIWLKEKGKWRLIDEITPTDSTGATWDEIPFLFLGAQTNSVEVDNPPILPLAMLNIKHYRNSADNEESTWFGVQNQPYINAEVSMTMMEELKNQDGVYYGNRQLMPFPIGVATSPENTQVSAEMDRKEQKMLALGARLVTSPVAAKTAAQVHSERDGQTSVLAMVASNVSEGYTKALEWVGRYMGVSDEMSYTLNQDFINMAMEPTLVQTLMNGYQMGNIPAADYVRIMKRIGIFDDDTPEDEYLGILAASTIL